MKDINLNGLDKIKADKELIEKTVNRIKNDSKVHFDVKKSAAIAASLVLIVGAASMYTLHNKAITSKESASKTLVHSDNGTGKTVANNNGTSYGNETNNTEKKEVTIDTNTSISKTQAGGQAVINKTSANTGSTPSKSVTNKNQSSNKPIVNANVVNIPAVNLNPNTAVHAKMLALVVYNGKIYTQSSTEFDAKYINNFLGQRVGRTTNSINEWNVKDKSTEELASNIGEQDIYTVKGYDSNFRIMSYSKINGQEFAQLFDCLNGITVKSGKDVFGKLNLIDNVESARFIKFDDWNNGTNSYVNFKDLTILNEALKELNDSVPYDYQSVGEEVDNYRNNDGFREFTLNLKDGSQLKFNVFKNGYVSYGYSNVYFKVQNSVIEKLWQ